MGSRSSRSSSARRAAASAHGGGSPVAPDRLRPTARGLRARRQGAPLRSAEYRVATVADHGLDLAFSRRGDLIGELGEAAGTGDRRQAPHPTRARWSRPKHAAHRCKARLEAPSANGVEASRDRIEDMAEPLGQHALTAVADAGVRHAHCGAGGGEFPGNGGDGVDGHAQRVASSATSTSRTSCSSSAKPVSTGCGGVRARPSPTTVTITPSNSAQSCPGHTWTCRSDFAVLSV